MLKAKGIINGKDTFVIGFSFGNLARFKKEPLDTYILIEGREHNLPVDIFIFSGPTEADLVTFIEPFLSKDTITKVSSKLKN